MKFRRALIASIVAVALTQGACMGSFELTRRLYNFNDTLTGSKIINNVVFWALIIIPVYSLAITGDAVILNLIEFWTGKNLLASDVEKRDDGSLRVVKNGDELVATPVDATHVRVTKNGVLIGVLEVGTDGALAVNDANGYPLDVIPTDEQEAMTPAVESLASR